MHHAVFCVLFVKAALAERCCKLCAHLPPTLHHLLSPDMQGVEEMMSSGTLAGFPVVDVTATLHDGSFHDVDSSVLAFQIAARMAFREGMRKGAVRLLEPIMKVSRLAGHTTCCHLYSIRAD